MTAENQTAETSAEEAVKKLQATFQSNPEIRQRAEQMREERERDARARKILELRNVWNAPKRHLLNSNQLQIDGEWGKRYEMLKSKIGSGMMIGLVGGRGPGKTQLAVEMMKESTSRLRSAYFMCAADFFIRIKGSFRKDSDESEGGVMKDLRGFKLLVIDEVGKRGESDWENTLLFTLLNARYNDATDTLLIDNNDPDEFSRRIGPSLASRMNEAGGIIHCDWPSFRG